jgi:hypothetical protein
LESWGALDGARAQVARAAPAVGALANLAGLSKLDCPSCKLRLERHLLWRRAGVAAPAAQLAGTLLCLELCRGNVALFMHPQRGRKQTHEASGVRPT